MFPLGKVIWAIHSDANGEIYSLNDSRQEIIETAEMLRRDGARVFIASYTIGGVRKSSK